MARRGAGLGPPVDPDQRVTLGLATALPGILLVVVIFWALAAVLMLTGTLINAREIDDTVEVINGEVNPIDKDLDNVKLAGETGRLTDRIRERARPLTGQLTDVIRIAGRIDRNAKSILGTAGEINQTAKTINGTVGSIGSNVQSIGGTVVSIHSTVNRIGGDVFSIGRTARSIFAKVGPINSKGNQINAQVIRILSDLSGVDRRTRSIDPGVRAINQKAIAAVGLARDIKGDFEGILSNTGSGRVNGAPDYGSGGKANINGHANSIDCAPVIRLFGPTQYCGQ
jgi:methyl-accepting chemotaxis protein